MCCPVPQCENLKILHVGDFNFVDVLPSISNRKSNEMVVEPMINKYTLGRGV